MTKNDRLPTDRLLSREESATQTGSPVAQERFSEEEMKDISRDFAARFQEAFRGLRQVDIARRLLTTEKSAGYYMKGERFPIFEMLLQIHRATGVSMNWLVLGKGAQKEFNYSELFSESERAEIGELAKTNNRTFEEEVRRLATAGLAAVRNYRG